MKSRWSIFIDAKTQDKAEKVFSRFHKQFGSLITDLKTEPYHKGGFKTEFTCTGTNTGNGSNWPAMIYHTLQLAQRVGNSWILDSDIEYELDAWSNESTVSGVTNLHVVLTYNNP